jgi:hypothetical protein
MTFMARVPLGAVRWKRFVLNRERERFNGELQDA